LDGAERILRENAPRPIAAILDNPPREGELVVAGLITSLERRVNKKGEPWAICTVEDNAVRVSGRVNWREDKISVFGGGLASLDLSTAGDDEPPLLLQAVAEKLDEDVVRELRQTLLAHKGTTPVRLNLTGRRDWLYALDDYPVAVSSMLLGELKSIPGITPGGDRSRPGA
jgi:DNA polymerase-3 subunit alpha